MIDSFGLVLYKHNGEYKFAIISDDKKFATLVEDKNVVNFNKDNIFIFKYTAFDPVKDDYVEVESPSFYDFMDFAIASDQDRKNIFTYPEPKNLPSVKELLKVREQMNNYWLHTEDNDLRKIEKYLNKILFKKLEKHKQLEKQDGDLENDI